MTITNDYLIEKRLQTLDPKLQRRFRDSVCVLPRLLSGYRRYFPEYTDHSELHALTIINYCNQLIDEDVQQLNADELYVLLMGCYLHDVGMGISESDYESFCRQIDFGDHFDTHDGEDTAETIRAFHHDFSGCFVRKYAELFDIPTEEHTFAIIQTCRGHRKTDLFDENEYPQRLALPGGNTICLPYLAAILRLADELDVTDERNPMLLYDVSRIKDERQVFEHKKHLAINEMDITQDAFILHVDTPDREVYDGVVALAVKMQKTLDYCVEVVQKRTPYEITQQQVLLQEDGEAPIV